MSASRAGSQCEIGDSPRIKKQSYQQRGSMAEILGMRGRNDDLNLNTTESRNNQKVEGKF